MKTGAYCRHCYMMENHFTKVCLSEKNKYMTEFDVRHRRTTAGRYKHANVVYAEDSDENSDGDDYVVHSYSAYTLQKAASNDDKFFTWLPVSNPGNKTVNVLMQVDSTAIRNTLPSKVFEQLQNMETLLSSKARIIPYSAKPIWPLGKTSLLC